MQNVNKKITPFLKKNKKILFILLYLIILPVVTLTIVYSMTYLNGRPQLFKTTVDSKEEYVSTSKFKDYTKSKYVIIAPKINYTPSKIDKKEKTVVTNGKLEIILTIEFKNKDIKYVKNSAKVNIEIDTYWTSNKQTSYDRTLYESSSWDTNKQFNDCTAYFTLNKYLPTSPLLFVKIDEKDYHIFLKLSFKVERSLDDETTEVVEYLKISAKQWNKLLKES